MKIVKKIRKNNGRRQIYVCGVKVLSYKKKKKAKITPKSDYENIFVKRFSGLTLAEKRFILEEQFKEYAGYNLDLANPKTFNEKLQWLKLYYHNPSMTMCADKVAARDYIAEKIGAEYLVPIIGVYDSVDAIDWDKLPNKFVAKVNWGSGQNIICKDKASLNIAEVKQKLAGWMRPEENHYYGYLEWPYKNIQPKIIIEKYIDALDDDLLDYKILCYNGKAKNLFVCSERQTDLKVTFFDLNWNKLPFKRKYNASNKEIAKPKNFDKMLQVAEKLAQDFVFARIDFFEMNEKLFVGEITFFPGNGTEPFEPMEWDKKLGDLLKLPTFPYHVENMEKQSVALVHKENAVYPKEAPFRPSELYPECPFKELSQEKNEIYNMVREGFHLMGLDKENEGTSDWNPLKDLISPGNTVLIKPNLVLHHNATEEGEECLFTQPSVVAPMIDYVYKALQGKGKIIVGDAPVQECVFDELIQNSGYDKLIAYYKEKGIDIELLDFRNVATYVKDGVHYSQRIADAENGVIVDLNHLSAFCGLDKERISNMRITNYDPRILQKHHTAEKHEYNVARRILEADVIINMPKPKSHRKAGMTGALKNMVGMNANKEFLPHHTNGSKQEKGDAYLHASPLLLQANAALDKGNMLNAEGDFKKAKKAFTEYATLLNQGRESVSEKFWEGSWYGNDTIWRTVFDLNKILLYANKNGQIQNTRQRKYFIVADMIVAGNKEGPLIPSPKKCGVIGMGYDAVCFDIALGSIMGFDWHKVPTIYEAYHRLGGVCEITCGQPPMIKSNLKEWDNKSSDEILKNYSFNFEPTSGWKGHI